MWLDFRCQTSKKGFYAPLGWLLYLSTPPPTPPTRVSPWVVLLWKNILLSDNSSKDKDKAIISGFHGFPGLTVSPLEGLFISSTNEMGAGGGGAKLNLLQ